MSQSYNMDGISQRLTRLSTPGLLSFYNLVYFLRSKAHDFSEAILEYFGHGTRTLK